MEEEKEDQPGPQIEEETKKLDRKEFLKTLGAGIGAIGLGLASGQPALGLPSSADKPSSRAEIQAFVRDLIRDPHFAAKFLENPEVVVRMYRIRLSDQDLTNIHKGLMRLAADRSGTLRDQPDKMRGSGKVVLPKDKIDKIYRDISRRDPRILDQKTWRDQLPPPPPPPPPWRDQLPPPPPPPPKRGVINPSDKMKQLQKQKYRIYQ